MRVLAGWDRADRLNPLEANSFKLNYQNCL